jgi:hypothetical protein
MLRRTDRLVAGSECCREFGITASLVRARDEQERPAISTPWHSQLLPVFATVRLTLVGAPIYSPYLPVRDRVATRRERR